MDEARLCMLAQQLNSFCAEPAMHPVFLKTDGMLDSLCGLLVCSFTGVVMEALKAVSALAAGTPETRAQLSTHLLLYPTLLSLNTALGVPEEIKSRASAVLAEIPPYSPSNPSPPDNAAPRPDDELAPAAAGSHQPTPAPAGQGQDQHATYPPQNAAPKPPALRLTHRITIHGRPARHIYDRMREQMLEVPGVISVSYDPVCQLMVVYGTATFAACCLSLSDPDRCMSDYGCWLPHGHSELGQVSASRYDPRDENQLPGGSQKGDLGQTGLIVPHTRHRSGKLGGTTQSASDQSGGFLSRLLGFWG